MPLLTLAPTGDTVTGNPYPILIIQPGVPPTHFDKVQTNDGDATRVLNDGVNTPECDMFTFPACGLPPITPINSVTLHIVARKVAVGAPLGSNGSARLWTHAVGYEYAHVLAVVYTDFSDVLALNPNTLAAWTVAEIDAAIFGVRLEYAVSGVRLTLGVCTQVYLVVSYVSGGLRRMLLGVGL